MGLTCDSPLCKQQQRAEGGGGRPAIDASMIAPSPFLGAPTPHGPAFQSTRPSRTARQRAERVEVADRPGLLMVIVDVLTGMFVSVMSAEIDTEGVVAKDVFTVSYRGGPLDDEMTTLTPNALNNTLSLPDIEAEESY
ncbi:unnamed protein product [Closterium sp. NIES-64]|nr:unnamed protein product [Closterium sp. NIES-64]